MRMGHHEWDLCTHNKRHERGGLSFHHVRTRVAVSETEPSQESNGLAP